MKDLLNELAQGALLESFAKDLGLPTELFEGVKFSDLEAIMESKSDSTMGTAEKLGELLGIGKPIGESEILSGGISECGSNMRVSSQKEILYKNYSIKSADRVNINFPINQAKNFCNEMLNSIDAFEKGTLKKELEDIGTRHATYKDGELISEQYVKTDKND